ncbi:TolC family protein [Hyphobacterium sp. CCMP332]|nr:TolC family protein [Hyphobacterium sp. CCMP332]
MKSIVLLLISSLLAQFVNAQAVEAKKWTLQECIEKAQNENLDVQSSRLNLESAGYTLDQNNWNQAPSVNAGAGYGFNWGRSIDPTTNDFRTERINSIGVNANANLLLWNGMQVRNAISRSKLDVFASEFELQTAKNNIALFVSNSFLTVVLNKELLQNNQFQLEIAKEQLNRTEKLVNAGSLPISNKLDLESQVATAELNVINAENALSLSLLNLKQLLLIPASEPFDVEIPEVADPGSGIFDNSPEAIYDIATGNLPDIKAAEYRAQSAEYQQKEARGGYYPSLSLNAGLRSNYSSAADRERFISDGSSVIIPNTQLGYLRESDGSQGVAVYESPFSTLTTDATSSQTGGSFESSYPITEQLSDNISQNLSVNLSIPIFNNMQTRINVQRSKIAYERAQITKKSTENRVRNDIEQAYNNAVASSKTFQARQKQVDALKEAFRVTEQRYNLGVVNSTDYQVALNNLNAAETDLVRAKYDYIFSLKVLDFYQGKDLY